MSTAYYEGFYDTDWSAKMRCCVIPVILERKRLQTKKRWGTSYDKLNATYEITDRRTKMNCNRGTTLEQSVEEILECAKLVLLVRYPHPILTQLLITITCTVCIGASCLISETSQWNTHNYEHYDKAKQSSQWRSEARLQENYKYDHDGTRQTLIVKHQLSETDWRGGRNLIWGPAHRHAKREAKLSTINVLTTSHVFCCRISKL